MVLDFDVKTFCDNLKQTKPPYECPVKTCRKVYKTYAGIDFHMHNHNHDSPDSPSTGVAPSPSGGSRKPQKRGHKGHRWSHNIRQTRPSPVPPVTRSPPRESIIFVESQRCVEIDLDGCLRRIDISQPIEIISQDEIENQDNAEKEEHAVEKNPPTPGNRSVRNPNLDSKKGKEPPAAIGSLPPNLTQKKLPEPSVKELEEWVKPKKVTGRNSTYYKYVEKSVEELDEEIEYDMDEEVS